MLDATQKPAIGGSGLGDGGGKGSSGGGSGSSTPDSIKNKAYAESLFVLSEGQIAGFPSDLLKSLYIDNTPIRSESGVDFYKDVQAVATAGTPDQLPLQGFSYAKREYPVGVTVRQATPLVRTLIDPDAWHVSVRIRIPSLFDATNNKGEIRPTTLQFKVEISSGGGPFVEVLNKTYNDKTNSPYEESWRFDLPRNALNRWDVRLTRITPDSGDVKKQNDLVWQSYTGIQAESRSYPNTALMGVRIDSEQFNSIPNFLVDFFGRIVKTPHNYNIRTGIYSGTFNGTLIPDWSDNPAWHVYDVLINERFGYGLDPSLIDVYSFYSAARYNDESIPDGKSGWVKRYVFNHYFNERIKAHEMLDTICSSFRANLIWQDGKVVLIQDRPSEISRIFCDQNVIREVGEDGTEGPAFNYDQVAIESVYTAVNVKWINPDLGWKPDDAYVENAEAIGRYGYNLLEIDGVGITNYAQAYRFGEWALYTSLNQQEVLKIKVGSEGLTLMPLEVLAVSDPTRAGGRKVSGRIADILSDRSILLDDEIEIEAGQSYVLRVLNDQGRIVNYNLIDPVGMTRIVTASRPFDVSPVINTVYQIVASNLQPQLFQLLKVNELEDDEYELECVNFHPGKFDYVERDIPLAPIPITLLDGTKVLTAPYNIQVNESLFEVQLGVKNMIQVLWGQTEDFVDRWELEYRALEDGQDFKQSGVSYSKSMTLIDLAPGAYEFRVRAIGKNSTSSQFSTITVELYGLTEPPKALTNFNVSALNGQARLTWDLSTDLDVRVGGRILIRHTPNNQPNLADWGSATPVNAGIPGNSTEALVPLRPGCYLIKAVDSLGKESPVSVVSTQNLLIQLQNIVADQVESPAFIGVKTNCVKVGNVLQLVDITQQGIYEFSQVIDLGSVYDTTVSALLDASAFNINSSELWDSAPGLWDDRPGKFDGSLTTADAEGILQVATSIDEITYGDWTRLQVSQCTARFFKFRLLLNSYKPGINLLVSQLKVTLDMIDRTESGLATSLVSGVQTVNFSRAYKRIPDAVGVTLQNGQSGDFIEITNITASGFQIRIRNSAGTLVARNLHWITKSY